MGRKDVFRSLEAYGAADGPGQRQGEIRDITTGKVLKSFTISEPILPGKASPPGSKKDVRKQNSGKRHVTRAATIREMRTQLGMSKKDIARAQQLLLDLKL